MSAHDEAVEAGLSAFNTHNAHREPWQMTHAHELDAAAACVRAYLAHMAAAGWKLTPREATVRMGDLGGEAIMTEYGANKTWETATDMAENLSPDAIWSAMWDRAPSPEEAP